MAMGSLLRCLVSPAGGVAAWLPCHELLATPYSGWQHWFSSLRLRRRLQASPRAAPRLRRPSRGPLHRLLLHGSHAPPGRPRRRRKGYLLIPKPSIGDIVFFKVPTALQNYGVNKDVVFIKRVLATPGDFIEVRQGQLIINGVAQKEHYTATHASYTMEAMVCAFLYFVSIVSLNNIEELLLPGPEMLLTQWVNICY